MKGLQTESSTTRRSRSAKTIVGRRDVLIGAAAAAGVSAVDLGEAQAATAPEKSPPEPGDRFQVTRGDLKGQLLKPEMLEIGAAPLEGFPFDPAADLLKRKNRLNRVLMIRLVSDEMDDPTRERSVDGVLVYSAVCTHRSCTIKSWKAEERHLRCHCHLSEFDALSEGSVMSGPARKQLPMVPIGLDDEGFVIAMAGFTKKPGGAKK